MVKKFFPVVLLFFLPWRVDAQQGVPSTVAGEVRDFTLPERNKEGVLIWEFSGARAKIRPDNKMEIEHLKLVTFRKNLMDWTLSTPACVLDRISREAVSDSKVHIVNSKEEAQCTEINGMGFHWLSNESKFIIRNQAEVILHGGISKTEIEKDPPAQGGIDGLLPGKTTQTDPSSGTRVPTTIHSETLDFDYEKRIALFEGQVEAVDPKLTVRCRKMNVLFSHQNGEVVRVEGMGDVHLLHDGREAQSDKAVYTRETGIVVLTEGIPQMRDEKGNWIKGDSIVYDTHTRILKVEKPRLEFVPSSGGDMFDAPHSTTSGSSLKTSKTFPPTSGERPSFVLCAGGDVNLFGQKKPSKIDANFLTHDFQNHNAIFEGDVHVLDTQLEMKCKKMIVYFSSESNEVVRVEGYGNVHLYQQGKEAASEKAVFTRDNGILVLTEGSPMMKDAGGNWVKGAAIIYNTKTKVMHVENSRVEFKPGTHD